MFVTRRSLPRRTLLRGMGAALALPLLEAMVPALTPVVQTAAAPRKRFGAIYIPHGAIMDRWTPAASGTGFEITPILKPLEPFRQSLVVVTQPGPSRARRRHQPRRRAGVVAGRRAAQAHGRP